MNKNTFKYSAVILIIIHVYFLISSLIKSRFLLIFPFATDGYSNVLIYILTLLYVGLLTIFATVYIFYFAKQKNRSWLKLLSIPINIIFLNSLANLFTAFYLNIIYRNNLDSLFFLRMSFGIKFIAIILISLIQINILERVDVSKRKYVYILGFVLSLPLTIFEPIFRALVISS